MSNYVKENSAGELFDNVCTKTTWWKARRILRTLGAFLNSKSTATHHWTPVSTWKTIIHDLGTIAGMMSSFKVDCLRRVLREAAPGALFRGIAYVLQLCSYDNGETLYEIKQKV